MKLAVLTCGMLPIPAVQGGAVENLIDFYLDYNNRKKLHDITVYSPWDAKVKNHPALFSEVNHYVYIDVTSFKARVARRLYGYFHHNEYYNHFIEYYFEKVHTDIKKKHFDYILIENGVGLVYKMSLRGYNNIILHLHNDGLNNQSKYHDIIIKSLTKIITVSDYIKGRVSTLQASHGKVQTVHNGIDLTMFIKQRDYTVSRKEIGFSNGDFVIVYSGRVNDEKGISELIDAMLLLRENINIKLMIVGGSFFGNTTKEDDFTEKLKEKALPLKGNIVFTGFIPYQHIPDYLYLADIAVLPSMWEEPFGLTIVEAMAVGLPLITTRSGGIPEICEGVAIFVDRINIVNNLVKAILELYEHPEKREQMATASLERAKLFDKEAYAEKIFEAIENV